MLDKSQTSAKMNMCGILHTGLAFLKHICKKSNMCGKNYHVSLNITLSFFDDFIMGILKIWDNFLGPHGPILKFTFFESLRNL